MNFDDEFCVFGNRFFVIGNFRSIRRADFFENRAGFMHHVGNAKIAADATWLNGAPINSSALDITPGAIGWLIRTQIQFAF